LSTRKLYWDDPFRTTFETGAAALRSYEGKPSVVLDATAFYPEGGGQLGDRGFLAVLGLRVPVLDVQIDDGGLIHHLVDEAPLAALRELVGAPGDAPRELGVAGEIEAARRRDHMSQHTGQHMLSRAMLDELGAATVSSRLGALTSSIDVDLRTIDEGGIARAEDRVSEAVLADSVIHTLFPSADELRALPLRREPKVTDNVRIIDIEGFDVSPCGGTHCTRTGQVGPLRITHVEKEKQLLRVTFLAGGRAVRDYRAKDAALAAIAHDFTCGPLEVAAGIARLRGELRARSMELGTTRAELARFLAAEKLFASPVDASGTTPVALTRDDGDLTMLRSLGGALATRDDVVALVAGRAPDGDWLVVIERGRKAVFDAGKWLRAFTQAHGGRGGGRAEHAEGRVPGHVDWAALAPGFDTPPR